MSSSFLLPAAGSSWTAERIQMLRRLAQEGRSAKEIAVVMKRTESAIRNKAGMHGISLKAAPRNVDAEPVFAALSIPVV